MNFQIGDKISDYIIEQFLVEQAALPVRIG